MKENVGTFDATVRFIIGAAIIVVGYYYNSWWGLLGLIPLATAAFRFCAPYTLLGINTCKGAAKKKKK
jgi:hypothetical protein